MENSNEYVIYKGLCYTVEWYYDQNSNSQAFDFYKKLDKDRKIQFLKLVKRIADHGQIYDITKFRSEGNKIFAFKPKPDRFLCFFFVGKKIVVTNAFTKKAQKLPEQEKERALKAMDNYTKRVQKGGYYE